MYKKIAEGLGKALGAVGIGICSGIGYLFGQDLYSRKISPWIWGDKTSEN